ncbi:MAG: cytochrome c biogenesis protein CcsA [Cyclobacteriaceae bacterium]|nr:cytochrome c biogenesis protein CcsA [Cyclobacteriaceae bacterium]MCK5277646.1 cytochrome c biogenesis protein CcsA [Cyclobacteriaceae bacterium]MCK5704480.1 cytochrome c biogenesis protein CcsA [Cyclobacteriaceae bacterium]
MQFSLKNNWWKILGIVLIYYVLIYGFLMDVPRLAILNETIRNLFFHVAIWFAMFILLIVSVVYSIKYLKSSDLKMDIVAGEFASMGIVFGLLGIVTGSVWAKFTWGDWWVNDPKLNATTIALLIYMAYFVLRSSIEDSQQKGRISAVYNIFAFAAAVPLIFILPRLTDSLHPGNGGNPGFSSYDLDNNLRMVFYPAVVAWTLIGVWFANLRIRVKKIEMISEDYHLN